MQAKQGQDVMLPISGQIVRRLQSHRSCTILWQEMNMSNMVICKICQIFTLCKNMHKFHLYHLCQQFWTSSWQSYAVAAYCQDDAGYIQLGLQPHWRLESLIMFKVRVVSAWRVKKYFSNIFQ